MHVLLFIFQLGLDVDVPEIFDPSKSKMGTGISIQFPVSPKDMRYNGISSGKELPLGERSVYFCMCSWRVISSEFEGHCKAFT